VLLLYGGKLLTVANPINKNIFVGDGAQTVFGFTFQFPASSNGSDIYLYLFDNLGNQFPVTSNFLINLGAKQVTYPVVAGVAPLPPAAGAIPANWTLVIIRIENIIQPLDLTTQGPFPAAGMMAALDYLTFICQQLQEQLGRAVLVPVNAPGPAIPVTPPSILPVGLVEINGTWAQLVAYSQLNPTVQFLGFVTSGDVVGQWFFYCGNLAFGNQGFIGIGGG